jgi:curli biogenesis system outer membrane secretion channel CsgG
LFGQQQAKKKVAVYLFDDSTVAHRSARQTGENQSIGQKLADAIVGKLAESGVYQVVDRQKMETLMVEQGYKADERFNPANAAKLGKLANVDAIISGTVNAFSATTSQKSSSNFISKKTQTIGTVTLKVTARVISVETGSILAAPSAIGDRTEVLAEQSSSELVQGVGSKSSAGNLDNAINALVDKAIEASAVSLAESIVAKAASINSANSSGVVSQSPFKVVGVSDGQTFVNKGKNAGLKIGSAMQIYRVVGTGLTDPDSGKPITKKKGICLLTLSEVEDSSASGTCKGDVAQAADVAEVTGG